MWKRPIVTAILIGLATIGSVTAQATGEQWTGISSPSAAGDDSVVEVKVTNNGLRFAPDRIEVEKGDRIRLTFENGGGYHDLTLPGFDAMTRGIGPGESDTIEFVATRSGTYEFYCSVPGHRARGMDGDMVVSGEGFAASRE